MPRTHLFEFGDQPWLPSFIRDGLTDYLKFAMRVTGQDKMVMGPLLAAIRETGATRLVDMAAGGGGLTDCIVETLNEENLDTTLVLSDLFPNERALTDLASRHDRVEAVLQPQDAREIPQERTGLRMMINAFHHLRPDEGRAVLKAAHDAGQPVLIMELVGREAPFILGMLGTPLIITLTSPFWKPFRLTNLVFTWLFPVMQPIVAFDGVVSCLRVYDEEELMDLVKGLDDFDWRVERPPLGNEMTRATVLIGQPK